jgi:hypothetical protein
VLQVSCAVGVVDLATVLVKLIRFRNVRERSMSFSQRGLGWADKIVAVKVRRLQWWWLRPGGALVNSQGRQAAEACDGTPTHGQSPRIR